MDSKAQTVSTDALIAMALFIIVIIFFFSLSTDTAEERKVNSLQFESTKLVSSVTGSRNASSAFVSGTKVSESRIGQLADLNYERLKDVFGVHADFCIYFEDEEGNVINVTGNKTGIGSSHIKVGGVACG